MVESWYCLNMYNAYSSVYVIRRTVQTEFVKLGNNWKRKSIHLNSFNHNVHMK